MAELMVGRLPSLGCCTLMKVKNTLGSTLPTHQSKVLRQMHASRYTVRYGARVNCIGSGRAAIAAHTPLQVLAIFFFFMFVVCIRGEGQNG